MINRYCIAMRFFLASLLALTLFGNPATVQAEVLVSFWSHQQDENYPHAFLMMQGRIEATGRSVNDNVGFTARRISPAVLITSVDGMTQRLSRGYLARPTTRPHFTLRVTDAQFSRLEAFIGGWRATRQPSYNLSSRNCVHFVMEAAATLGLRVNRRTGYVREPDAFLDEIVALNPSLAASAASARAETAARRARASANQRAAR